MAITEMNKTTFIGYLYLESVHNKDNKGYSPTRLKMYINNIKYYFKYYKLGNRNLCLICTNSEHKIKIPYDDIEHSLSVEFDY